MIHLQPYEASSSAFNPLSRLGVYHRSVYSLYSLPLRRFLSSVLHDYYDYGKTAYI